MRAKNILIKDFLGEETSVKRRHITPEGQETVVSSLNTTNI